jgi:hypothetical protein
MPTKRKPGPPLEPSAESVRPRTYNVDPLTERKLEAINPSNKSVALREAVRFYYAHWARQS